MGNSALFSIVPEYKAEYKGNLLLSKTARVSAQQRVNASLCETTAESDLLFTYPDIFTWQFISQVS